VESDPVGLNGGVNTYGYAAESPLMAIDPSGLMISGSWIKPPILNIEHYGIDGWSLTSPSWSWWGYLTFVRLYGHASGYVNVDVKCTDGCKQWEIHNRIDVAAKGYDDVGLNLYATAAVTATRSYWIWGAVQIAMAGGATLQAEQHILSLIQQKAGPIIQEVRARGPDALCLLSDPQ